MVFILGDSILRNFNGYGLSKLVKHEFNFKSIFYPRATVSFLKGHIKRTAHVSKAGKISPHVGTNDFVTDKIPMQTYNDIITLPSFVKDNEIKVVFVSRFITQSWTKWERKSVNIYLISICESVGKKYIAHKNICIWISVN